MADDLDVREAERRARAVDNHTRLCGCGYCLRGQDYLALLAFTRRLALVAGHTNGCKTTVGSGPCDCVLAEAREAGLLEK